MPDVKIEQFDSWLQDEGPAALVTHHRGVHLDPDSEHDRRAKSRADHDNGVRRAARDILSQTYRGLRSPKAALRCPVL